MENLMEEIDDLNKAVDLFAMLMKRKLTQKARKGWRGWDNKKFEDTVRERLLDNIQELKKDTNKPAINIANLVMMIWYMNLPKLNL